MNRRARRWARLFHLPSWVTLSSHLSVAGPGWVGNLLVLGWQEWGEKKNWLSSWVPWKLLAGPYTKAVQV